MNHVELLARAEVALKSVEDYVGLIKKRVQERVVVDGRAKSDLINREQRAVHGYAWVETTYTALLSVRDWAQDLLERNVLKDADGLALEIAFGEYLTQIISGIPMAQNELIRPADFGVNKAAMELAAEPLSLIHI